MRKYADQLDLASLRCGKQVATEESPQAILVRVAQELG